MMSLKSLHQSIINNPKTLFWIHKSFLFAVFIVISVCFYKMFINTKVYPFRNIAFDVVYTYFLLSSFYACRFLANEREWKQQKLI
jgi:hypothetical protein